MQNLSLKLRSNNHGQPLRLPRIHRTCSPQMHTIVLRLQIQNSLTHRTKTHARRLTMLNMQTIHHLSTRLILQTLCQLLGIRSKSIKWRCILHRHLHASIHRISRHWNRFATARFHSLKSHRRLLASHFNSRLQLWTLQNRQISLLRSLSQS